MKKQHGQNETGRSTENMHKVILWSCGVALLAVSVVGCLVLWYRRVDQHSRIVLVNENLCTSRHFQSAIAAYVVKVPVRVDDVYDLKIFGCDFFEEAFNLVFFKPGIDDCCFRSFTTKN